MGYCSMDAFQILYLPTGEYVNSKNRANSSVLFSDLPSAEKMIVSIVDHKAYIGGAPLADYCVGAVPATQEFFREEFECIPVHAGFAYPPPKILTLA